MKKGYLSTNGAIRKTIDSFRLENVMVEPNKAQPSFFDLQGSTFYTIPMMKSVIKDIQNFLKEYKKVNITSSKNYEISIAHSKTEELVNLGIFEGLSDEVKSKIRDAELTLSTYG